MSTFRLGRPLSNSACVADTPHSVLGTRYSVLFPSPPSLPGCPAFGLFETDGTVLTVLDILLATDAQADGGRLYDRATPGTISSLERTLRVMANGVFTEINERGGM